MQRITTSTSQLLHSVDQTRALERLAAASLSPHTLMQRAGLAVARLTLALAPHAQTIWIACGPGNNGGDGFEAALHLHQWGKKVVLTWTGVTAGKTQPPDAEASRQRALAAGVTIAAQAPEDFDFCIDALLGLGATMDDSRPGDAQLRQWLDRMQASGKPRLCVDLPTGLNADTGQCSAANLAADAIQSVANTAIGTGATTLFTLSLLTLKPGLFTADGRDKAGEIWFDDLGVDAASGDLVPSFWLLGKDRTTALSRAHAAQASHKGSFGDVAILGGESSVDSHMAGAALLAARSALHAGAGRVFVALVGHGDAGLKVDTVQPELMFRSPGALNMRHQVVVGGCGGGEAIRGELPRVLSTAPRLVLDADALNVIADDTTLQALLKARQGRGYSTILTPHPLEAARLAGTTVLAVQTDRIKAATALATLFGCVLILKGSGTIVSDGGAQTVINSSGNAMLATAGTGDVLAGMVGACLASGLNAFEAACSAVFAHGELADEWRTASPNKVLTASRLAQQFR
jgi:hydroxyethylthiazole kinase-like uncharacterized protein yjeF